MSSAKVSCSDKERSPKELAERANGAPNLFHVTTVFAVRYATGVVLQHWTPQAGHDPEIADQTALALNLALQVVAWIWFMFAQVGIAPKISRRSVFSPLRRSLCRTATKVCDRFCGNRCGPSCRRTRDAPARLKNFVRQPKRTFSAVSTLLGHRGPGAGSASHVPRRHRRAEPKHPPSRQQICSPRDG